MADLKMIMTKCRRLRAESEKIYEQYLLIRYNPINGVDYSKQTTRSNGHSDPTESTVEKAETLYMLYWEKKTESLEAEKEALRLIKSLESEMFILILLYRYINGYSWDEIQLRLGLSKSQVFKIHADALKSIEAMEQ